VGALAEQWFNDDAGHEPVAVRGLSVHGTDEESIGNTAGPGWNVLAEEIVAYPPRSKRIWLERKYEDLGGQPERDGLRGRAYADAWLDRELASLRDRRRAALESHTSLTAARRANQALVSWTPCANHLVGDPATPGAAVRTRDGQTSTVRSSPARRARAVQATAARPRTGAALIGPRGLRRLLPGAATLAVLVGTWFGIGAVATSAHRVSIDRIPGSVPVHGGFRYVAQPGDTLWSIASRVEPGADPRPLVDELEVQLGGRSLQPGDPLILPS
jgi:hypothetical protein